METILIRNLPDGTKALLEVRAHRNRRSVEGEARAILGDVLSADKTTIVDFLAAEEGITIEFEPQRLGATARSEQL